MFIIHSDSQHQSGDVSTTFDNINLCAWRECGADVVDMEGVPFCLKHAIRAERDMLGFTRRMSEKRGITPTDEARPEMKSSGVVYFMLKGDRIKIGFTTNLRQRAYAIKPDRVLGYFKGDLNAERAAHDAFAEFALGHEWFRATPQMLAKIDSLMKRPQAA